MNHQFEVGQKAIVFEDSSDVVEVVGIDPNYVDNQGNNLIIFRDIDGHSTGSISPQALTILEETEDF